MNKFAVVNKLLSRGARFAFAGRQRSFCRLHGKVFYEGVLLFEAFFPSGLDENSFDGKESGRCV